MATWTNTPSHVLTGGRAIFKINSVKIAWATDVSWTKNHEHLPIQVLDQLEPIEYAPTGYFVSMTASGFRVPQYSAMGQGFMPPLSQILMFPELQITLEDKVTGQVILYMYRVKCIGASGNISTRSVSTETYNFVGISMGDESIPDPGTSVTSATAYTVQADPVLPAATNLIGGGGS